MGFVNAAITKAIRPGNNLDPLHQEAALFDQGKGGLIFQNVPAENIIATLSTNRPIDPIKIKSMKSDILQTKQIKPIIATRVNNSSLVHIEDGHHRAIALQQLNAPEIPTYVVDPAVHDPFNDSGQVFTTLYKKSKLKAPVTLPNKKLGGAGSGNWNHEGRPGEVGGSAPQEGGGTTGVADAAAEVAKGEKAGKAGKSKGPKVYTEEEKKRINDRYNLHRSQVANPKGKDTNEQYRTPDGKWTPEREALHKEIEDKVFGKNVPLPPEQAAARFLMGGGTAVGKSSLTEYGFVTLPDNTIIIDSDKIKALLPEYEKGLMDKDPTAAKFTHEESSYLAKQFLARASKENYNLQLDGTGDGSLDGLKTKTDTMRAGGHIVEAVYATVPVDVAIAREKKRAEETGRKVYPEFLYQNHRDVSRVVPEAVRRGYFDKFTLYDTNGRPPKVIASAVGTKLKIHDQKAWDAFIAKGAQ